jgi:hypothetical protein
LDQEFLRYGWRFFTIDEGQMKPPIPTESQEQQAVIAWADSQPIIRGRVYAIPNGAHKTYAAAAKFKKEGLRAGYPDLGLDMARGGYHGLRIEMKRLKQSRTTPEQKDWKDFLTSQGYASLVCQGANDAIGTIKAYLNLGVFK